MENLPFVPFKGIYDLLSFNDTNNYRAANPNDPNLLELPFLRTENTYGCFLCQYQKIRQFYIEHWIKSLQVKHYYPSNSLNFISKVVRDLTLSGIVPTSHNPE